MEMAQLFSCNNETIMPLCTVYCEVSTEFQLCLILFYFFTSIQLLFYYSYFMLMSPNLAFSC